VIVRATHVVRVSAFEAEHDPILVDDANGMITGAVTDGERRGEVRLRPPNRAGYGATAFACLIARWTSGPKLAEGERRLAGRQGFEPR
jgi:hypothetical protein